MSKEHKITKDDKKYITKIVYNNSCNGCVFKLPTSVKYSKCDFYHVTGGCENKCLSLHYKDGLYRIWVEDKTEDKTEIKPKKDCVWVIEELYGDDWLPVSAKKTRKLSRDYADALKDCSMKLRVRKFTSEN